MEHLQYCTKVRERHENTVIRQPEKKIKGRKKLARADS